MVLVSFKEGNIVIGRLQDGVGISKYIVYDDFFVFKYEIFFCGMEDSGIGYKCKDFYFEYEIESRDVGDCVCWYIEVDKDIYDNKGGIVGVINYVIGFLN